MALSDDDQRILDEMEQNLRAESPRLVATIQKHSVYRFAGHKMIWAAVAFVFGLVFMFFTFASNIWLGMLGVAIMFAAGVVIVNNLRRMGTAGRADLAKSIHSREERSVDLEQWFRSKFPRRD